MFELDPSWSGGSAARVGSSDGGAPSFDEVGWEELLADGRDGEGWEAPPEPGFDNCDPSGWLGLELDTGTADPAVLSDATLIEAIIGFDRMTSWAAARQARLLAELARRRPADPVPNAERPSVGSRFTPDEVGVALKLSRGAAVGRIGTACRLLSVLPATHALWQAGRIDTAKARAVEETTLVLPDALAAAVEARVLPRAPQQSLQQLRAALARAILAVDPDGAAERHQKARRDRRVSVHPEPDGMGSLWALLTATDAQGAYAWLTRLARGLGTQDPRSMDTRRADLLADLLNGRLPTHVETVDHDPDDHHPDDHDPDDQCPDDPAPDPRSGDPGSGDPGSGDPGSGDPGDSGAAAIPRDAHAGDDPTPSGPGTAEQARPGLGTGAGAGAANGNAAGSGTGSAGTDPTPATSVPVRPVTPGKPLIQIVMAHSTLIGADDQPAELVGHGPIPASLAREIAADAVWHRLLTDPASGALLDYGRSTYHPPAALADHVRARDQHCRFPHCRRPAADTELDHVLAWTDGGHTCAANLRALCVHHHKLKTHAGWRVQAHPDGRLTWTTPTGHRHTTEPHDYHPDPPGADPPGADPPGAPAPDEPASTDRGPTPYDPDLDPPPF
jgi:Domain of unknown function (DUF222)